jgi:hypothetical protein
MQRLNPWLLDAYIAAWTGSDRRLNRRQVENLSAGTEPKLNAANRRALTACGRAARASRASARIGCRTGLAFEE